MYLYLLKWHNSDFQNEIYTVNQGLYPLKWLGTTFKMVFGKELKNPELIHNFSNMIQQIQTQLHRTSQKNGSSKIFHFLFGKYSFTMNSGSFQSKFKLLALVLIVVKAFLNCFLLLLSFTKVIQNGHLNFIPISIFFFEKR